MGLAGSGGSTPLRLTVSSDPDYYLFAKLYAMSHVRADRWYKFGRTILYGRLEDEAPFQSVRRLVEYEDYAARVLRDNGIPTAELVRDRRDHPDASTSWSPSSSTGRRRSATRRSTIGVIDNGLIIVRRLWDAGLAHRDIKPANLLVRNGQVFLIDAFFVQVRPSPWRQAVDLANMMLVLARADRLRERVLRACPAVVHPGRDRRGVRRDTRRGQPDAAARCDEARRTRPPRGVPRARARRDSRSRCSVGACCGCCWRSASWPARALSVVQVVNLLQPATDSVGKRPTCGTDDVMVLMAEAVPEATLVPCIGAIPAGWTSTRPRSPAIGRVLARLRHAGRQRRRGDADAPGRLRRVRCGASADRRAGHRTLRGSTAAASRRCD